MRRAQVEIMGLAMVVILLSLGMLFVVRFAIQEDKPREVQRDYRPSKVAANLMNAMMKTTTDCGMTLTELMQDCMTYETIQNCSHNSSCVKVNRTLILIFNKTLQQERTTFNFTIKSDMKRLHMNNTLLFGTSFGVDCRERQQSELYPIPLHPGTMFVQLDICG